MPAVTRRQSATPPVGVPTPPQSRSTSAATKKPKVKSRASSQALPHPPSPMKEPVGPQFSDDVKFVDTIAPAPDRPSHPKKTVSKKKLKPKNGSPSAERQGNSKPFFRSLLDWIAQLFLFGFTLYVLAVCPEDQYMKSPVCRTLSHYHHTFIEPSIFAPIRSLAQEPEIAPYVAKAAPYYNNAVHVATPYYNTLISNVKAWSRLIERKVRPYTGRLESEYSKHVEPHIRTFQIYYTKYYRLMEPYILRFFEFSRTQWAHFKPWAQDVWSGLKPHLIPIWNKLAEFPAWFLSTVLNPLRDLKRDYVDTHVWRILQKVSEEVAEHTHGYNSENAKGKGESASSSLTDSSLPTSIAGSQPAAETPVSHPAGGFAAASVTAQQEDDFDVDAFLSSLSSTDTTAAEEPAISPTPMSEEEIANAKRLRAIETAKKRADIEARHTQHEKDLVALAERRLAELKEEIAASHSKIEDLFIAAEGPVQRQMIKLLEEAENAAKGLEAYAKKLVSDKSTTEETQIHSLFDNIVRKVEDKFASSTSDMVKEVEALENQFKGELYDRVVLAGDELQSFAQSAQADLGMDYAWLDDVDVPDWTRYHKLVKSAKAQTSEYLALVDSHFQGPLAKAISDFHLQRHDLVSSFERHLGTIKKSALKILGTSDTTSTSAGGSEPTFSVRPITGDGTDRGYGSDGAEYIIGRGKEEVESAVSRAEEAAASARAQHQEL